LSYSDHDGWLMCMIFYIRVVYDYVFCKKKIIKYYNYKYSKKFSHCASNFDQNEHLCTQLYILRLCRAGLFDVIYSICVHVFPILANSTFIILCMFLLNHFCLTIFVLFSSKNLLVQIIHIFYCVSPR
jgi:hypothetical protein